MCSAMQGLMHQINCRNMKCSYTALNAGMGSLAIMQGEASMWCLSRTDEAFTTLTL